MNNLVIDVGNTKFKWGVFNSVDLHQSGDFLRSQTSEFFSFLATLNKSCQFCILSGSGALDGELVKLLESMFNVFFLSDLQKYPFSVYYSTPQSLGLDRLVNAAAAHALYPHKNCLIIDAGTCVTYDLLLASKGYMGGAISPGLNMRFQAMHTFTAKLPLVSHEQHSVNDTYIGDSSVASLQIGAVQGMVHEIDGFIQQYLTDYKDLTIIFTGGDARYLSTRLKSSIFVDLNFQLKGLNILLEHHKANA